MVDLTADQLAACDAAHRFVTAGRNTHFVLQGLAGTGKTTTLAELARRVPAATLCAPTGKAAAVLRGKTGRDVLTVHSAIYDFRGLTEDEETGRRRPVFSDKEDAGLRGRMVLLDECSMIGTRIGNDLLATGARVVACGDPGQLSPVADDPFFHEPDVTLTAIHRQALESPIIRQAHRVRKGQPYVTDGADFRVLARATEEVHHETDVALCWRNATRRALNRRRRALRGIDGPTLRAGEPVMCLQNDYRLRVFNGEIYPLARDREPGDDLLLDLGDRRVEALNARVEGIDADFETRRGEEGYSCFAPAYAVTTHKSQGSEWDRILVIDEFRGTADDRRCWLYTALTRARLCVTVIPW